MILQASQTILRRRRTSLPVPMTIAGLHTWYDASAITGLSDGAAVAQWDDQSGNARHATQATSGSQPTYRTGVANGRPVVRFDGSNDFFNLPNAYTGLTAATVFLVVEIDNDPPPADTATGIWIFGTSGSGNHYPYIDGSVYDDFGSNVRKSTGNPTPSLASAFRNYSVTTASGAWTSRIDGTQHFTTASNTVAFTTAPRLGGWLSTYFLDGDVAEFALYDSALGTTDRQAWEAYARTKYGLA